jgi:hypothetical protein
MLCEAGGCEIDGCLNNTECQDWAAAQGRPSADLYVCRTSTISTRASCQLPCTTTEDCCPEGCGAYPNRFECVGGFCAAACTGDTECQDWATAGSLPNPETYVCHTITPP